MCSTATISYRIKFSSHSLKIAERNKSPLGFDRGVSEHDSYRRDRHPLNFSLFFLLPFLDSSSNCIRFRGISQETIPSQFNSSNFISFFRRSQDTDNSGRPRLRKYGGHCENERFWHLRLRGKSMESDTWLLRIVRGYFNIFVPNSMDSFYIWTSANETPRVVILLTWARFNFKRYVQDWTN